MTGAAVALDPRMRARRIAVLRAHGRRRLHVLIVLACLALAATAAWGVTRTPLMDVDRIAITGVDSVRGAEVLERSSLARGLAMLYLDVGGAERSIASLPWVRSVRVWRDWPATVRIAVDPRVPVAAVPAPGGRTALIDAYGYAIGWAPASGSADDQLDVPHLSVPFSGSLGDIHTDADGPLAVVAAMPEDLRAWVRRVTLDPASEVIGLELRGGATVVVGEPDLLDDKISAVRALLAGTELECITEIDVTMPDIATVTRHSPCRPSA